MYQVILNNYLKKSDDLIFYTDGNCSYTWNDAFIYSNLILSKLKDTQNSIVYLDCRKDFQTYCTILSCYISGMTFIPINIEDIDKTNGVLNTNYCILSSSEKITQIKRLF